MHEPHLVPAPFRLTSRLVTPRLRSCNKICYDISKSFIPAELLLISCVIWICSPSGRPQMVNRYGLAGWTYEEEDEGSEPGCGGGEAASGT
jgi:hypothetical protein